MLKIIMIVTSFAFLGCAANSKNTAQNQTAVSRAPAGLHSKTIFVKEVLEDFSKCKIEKSIAGIESATVNFKKSKYYLETEDDRSYGEQMINSGTTGYVPGTAQLKKFQEEKTMSFSAQGEYSALEVCHSFVEVVKQTTEGN